MKITITAEIDADISRDELETVLQENADAERFDEALEDMLGVFQIPARIESASVEISE